MDRRSSLCTSRSCSYPQTIPIFCWEELPTTILSSFSRVRRSTQTSVRCPHSGIFSPLYTTHRRSTFLVVMTGRIKCRSTRVSTTISFRVNGRRSVRWESQGVKAQHAGSTTNKCWCVEDTTNKAELWTQSKDTCWGKTSSNWSLLNCQFPSEGSWLSEYQTTRPSYSEA